jgi:hypothetical protein
MQRQCSCGAVRPASGQAMGRQPPAMRALSCLITVLQAAKQASKDTQRTPKHWYGRGIKSRSNQCCQGTHHTSVRLGAAKHSPCHLLQSATEVSGPRCVRIASINSLLGLCFWCGTTGQPATHTHTHTHTLPNPEADAHHQNADKRQAKQRASRETSQSPPGCSSCCARPNSLLVPCTLSSTVAAHTQSSTTVIKPAQQNKPGEQNRHTIQSLCTQHTSTLGRGVV